MKKSQNQVISVQQIQLTNWNVEPYRDNDLLQKKPINIKSVQDSFTISCNHRKQIEEQLSILALEYKFSMSYASLLGLYIMPKLEDFFKWEIIMFIREGYYKNCKIKSQVTFSKELPIKIKRIRFIGPLYHPLIEFNTGQFDLALFDKIFSNQSESLSISSRIMSIRDVFLNEKYFKIENSFNRKAYQIYQKSEILFIEKIFETTLISSENTDLLKYSDQQYEENQNFIQNNEIENLHNQLKKICSSNSVGNTQFCQQNDKNSVRGDETNVKIKKFFDFVMS